MIATWPTTGEYSMHARFVGKTSKCTAGPRVVEDPYSPTSVPCVAAWALQGT
ncbi:uncharacterized protein L969DRAFT_47595 [Mixia osmundae IAM 14324]|uniref:Uncharacterized protein n=1 Tax=Mixia osmundae (strain CBS 9802 / IAM 14324 / JCM 22182 / KY 12970) TaxID=764103 RepID=G7E8Q0_MIXOS|nr:uncharacterized protein L969DRAFT_47595 [Mixia osmundae IAM 14324]KEI40154.1 hypothetical protein L969DRAFT_47595 [Mixia osmundae IAM 14324]GAA99518.1 hypothetical protein E5Q_06219 [Mixia osmundae IAM 14324]